MPKALSFCEADPFFRFILPKWGFAILPGGRLDGPWEFIWVGQSPNVHFEGAKHRAIGQKHITTSLNIASHLEIGREHPGTSPGAAWRRGT